METYIVLVIAAVIIFLGFIGELVFRKTNIPDVIWLILFGIVIGPVLNMISPDVVETFAPIFTTFTLIFILFEGALNINIREIFKGMYSGSMLAFVNFIMSVIVTSGIAYMFGMELIPSLLLGTVLGGTSSAVVIPIVRRLNISKSASTSLVLESAISDVLCIIGVVTIIQVIELGQLQVAEVLHGVLSNFVLALFIGGVGGYLWVRILSKISSYTKSFIITIAVMLLFYGFTEFIGSNGAIACFAFGVVMGNSKKILTVLNKNTTGSMKSSQFFFYSEIGFKIAS
ncbi:MAG: cation:proton antiporter [Nanoarchaeota archaeon]|nr:cation:proton antiporter [Nanoarchaeota archaeon]